MVWCVRIFGLDRCQSEPLKMPEEKPHIYNSEASSIKKCISIYLYVCVWVVKMGWGLKVWVGIYVVWLKMCVWWSCLNYFYN